jgi:arsenate reductase
MGNVAAAYYGLPEIRCYSGGTEPSAFNPRTMTALRAIGIQIEPQGNEAPRGVANAPNPIFRLRWGKSENSGEPALETIEFSKRYSDGHNPQRNFAALLVCGEAEEACPTIEGQSIRIPMRYLDPKMFDDSEYEAAKYAERRDDIGRLMLSVMMQARNRLAAQNESRAAK